MNIFLVLVVVLLIIILILKNRDALSTQNRKTSDPHKLHKSYLAGLNFLLNEEPDKAVDVFIQMLEVDTDTIETHLALGHLFRKRGEVDRAIRIHQNLIARPNLAAETKIQSLIALGQDYLSAGVLDRAERVFLEVITLDANNKISLLYLRDIYQQEKEWLKAIKISEKISDRKSHKYYIITAYYYCEMAELSFKQKGYDQALKYIKLALSIDSQCLRANLLLADMLINQKDYKLAIKYFKKIILLRPEFAARIVNQIEQCYLELGDTVGLLKTLKSMIIGSPCFAVFQIISKYLTTKSERDGLQYEVEKFLLSQPSVANLNAYSKMFNFAISSDNGHCERQNSQQPIVQNVLAVLEQRVPLYQCKQCGYAGNIFEWQCPSCKYWGEMIPNLGLAN